MTERTAGNGAASQPAAQDAAKATLQRGVGLHRAGRASEAEAAYRAVLAQDPRNADALHLLAVLSGQAGRPREALDLVREAISANAGIPSYHNTLGLALQRIGDLPGARDAVERAITLDPRYADAHLNLGNLQRRLGERDKALSHYELAIKLRPNFAEAACSLGHLLLDLDRTDEALPLLERAAALRPDHPDMLSSLGVALVRLGRPGAPDLFRRALAAKPDHRDALANLAGVLAADGDLQAADALYQKALALDPGNGRLSVGLGSVRVEQGRIEEARTCFTQARADRRAAGAALLGLHRLCRVTGQFDEARSHLLQALEADPDDVAALSGLAQLDKVTLDPALAERLGRLAERDGLDPLAAELAHRALSVVREASGDYEGSFGHLARANAVRLAALRRRGSAYDPAKEESFVDRLIETFDADFFQRVPDSGCESELPVLIVGLPRSGTTLCEQILASHTEVHGAGELNDIAVIADRLSPSLLEAGVGQAIGAFPEVTRAATAPVLRRLAEAYVGRLRSLAPAADRVADKAPMNYYRLGLIAKLLPRARLIHCRRSPLDTGLSCFATGFRATHSWSCELATIGHHHRQYARLMAHWRAVLPVPVFDFVYEDAVADLDKVARDLVAFCGLEWQDACLDFHRTVRPVLTASSQQVRQPIYATSVEKWRRYAAQLEPLRLALGVAG